MTRYLRTLSAFPLLPALFLLPLSLDFKGGDAGGSAWQFVITGSAVLAWVLFFTKNRFVRPRGGFWKLANWAIIWTLGGSLLSLAVNSTDFGNYARVFSAIVLFAMGFYFAVVMAKRGRTGVMNRLVERGCAISAVFSVGAGFLVTGQDVGEIRYQILSPVLLIFEAILLHNIFVTRVRTARSKLWLLACVGLQLVSVTRSALLAAALVFGAALWISSRSISKLTLRGMLLIPIAALGIGLASLVSPDLLSRWEERVFTTEKFGFDPTTISRVAEIKEQLDRWSSSPTSMLVGQGFGASYGWSKELYDVLLDTKAFQLDRIDEERFYFGHNYWVSSLFSGGLLFGLAIPAVLIYATFAALRASRSLLRSGIGEDARLEISRSALVLVAVLGMTIGGNPFGYRYSSMLAGVALGALVIWRRSALEQEQMVRAMTPMRQARVA